MYVLNTVSHQICGLQIFSKSVACLFILLTMSYTEQKFLTFRNPVYQFFFFYESCFRCFIKKIITKLVTYVYFFIVCWTFPTFFFFSGNYPCIAKSLSSLMLFSHHIMPFPPSIYLSREVLTILQRISSRLTHILQNLSWPHPSTLILFFFELLKLWKSTCIV